MDELQLEAEHSRLKVHKVQAEHEAYVRRSRENYEEKVINVFVISVVILITDQLSLVCMSVCLSLMNFQSGGLQNKLLLMCQMKLIWFSCIPNT